MKQSHVELTQEDKVYLEQLLKRGVLQVGVSKRALALLSLDRGATLQSVSEQVNMSYLTVLK